MKTIVTFFLLPLVFFSLMAFESFSAAAAGTKSLEFAIVSTAYFESALAGQVQGYTEYGKDVFNWINYSGGTSEGAYTWSINLAQPRSVTCTPALGGDGITHIMASAYVWYSAVNETAPIPAIGYFEWTSSTNPKVRSNVSIDIYNYNNPSERLLHTGINYVTYGYISARCIQ